MMDLIDLFLILFFAGIALPYIVIFGTVIIGTMKYLLFQILGRQ